MTTLPTLWLPLPLWMRKSRQLEGKTKSEAAEIVGEMVAKRAIEKGVKQVVFDRGGYLYTGRVQKLADGARKAGLEF